MKEYKALRSRANHKCFGCSQTNEYGLKMTFYGGDDSVISKLAVPEHLCGWNNLVHGGVISTILDEVMGRGAIHLLKRLPMTKSFTVDFMKPVYIGSEINAEGRVLEVTGEREARLEGIIYNAEGAVCARSTGLFALFTPEAARKKGILSMEAINELEAMISQG
jgi:uncharacterized protein (TIGR00369 family)